MIQMLSIGRATTTEERQCAAVEAAEGRSTELEQQDQYCETVPEPWGVEGEGRGGGGGIESRYSGVSFNQFSDDETRVPTWGQKKNRNRFQTLPACDLIKLTPLICSIYVESVWKRWRLYFCDRGWMDVIEQRKTKLVVLVVVPPGGADWWWCPWWWVWWYPLTVGAERSLITIRLCKAQCNGGALHRIGQSFHFIVPYYRRTQKDYIQWSRWTKLVCLTDFTCAS